MLVYQKKQGAGPFAPVRSCHHGELDRNPSGSRSYAVPMMNLESLCQAAGIRHRHDTWHVLLRGDKHMAFHVILERKSLLSWSQRYRDFAAVRVQVGICL